LRLGDVIAETGSSVTRVYFPHSGAISLVVEVAVDQMIETAKVGRDGAVNAACALDGKISFNKAIVQVAGAASVIAVDQLRAIADDVKSIRAALIHNEQLLFAQSQQSVACNAAHTLEARVCRWLLRTCDLADGNELFITQELFAQMVGVRRPSLSLTANELQKAGYIKYARGRIRILDRAGLERLTCKCYRKVRDLYDPSAASGGL
jgi:hypothetical protein